MKYVPGAGSSSAKLMIIGEAPGEHEERLGLPFVGPSGELLNDMLKAAGIDRDSTYVTNVVKIRPPANKINRLKELGKSIDDFLPQLFEEIGAIKPNCILALGNTPLNALTGKSGIIKYRGSILWSSKCGIKVVPTIHPAALLHQSLGETVFKYSAKAYIQLDMKRAGEESKSKTLKLPERHIEIIKDSYALHKFLEQFRNHKRFALDIETVRAIPVCLGIAPSPNFAVSVQLFNLPGVDYNIPKHEQSEIFQLLYSFLNSDREFIGQNWKFDADKLATIGLSMKGLYADTMLLASVVNPEFPKSLGFLASVYSREPYYKDEGREFILGKDPISNLFNYNGKDVCCTFEIYEKLVQDLMEFQLEAFFSYVMQLHDFYLALESNGLLVDFQAWSELRSKYSLLWNERQSELESLAGYDLNVASPKQVLQYVLSDLHLPTRSGTGDDILIQLLGNHAKSQKAKRSIELILEIRRIRKTIGTYLSAYPDFDGRMRTSYRISGTETGRSSTSILKPPLRPVKGFGQPFQVFTKHGDIGSDIRRMYVADRGFVFLECDESQAEARVVAILSEDYELLKLYDTPGFDVHKMTSEWVFGKVEIDYGKRYIGKKTRHAGNYGEGKRRAALDINSEAKRAGIPINVSEAEAGRILTVFHAKSPKIRGIFHAQIEYALRENKRVLISPHGRRRQFFERWGPDLFREAYAFIPQATVRDHGMQAALRVRKRLPELKFVAEAHDSFTVLCPKNELKEVAQVFKEEFEKEISFESCTLKRGNLRIPCEFKIGENYKDMEDYKL